MEARHGYFSSFPAISLVSPSCPLPSQYHLQIGYERRPTAKQTIQDILSVLTPTIESDQTRMGIINYIGCLIRQKFGVEVYPFGSTPLKTYLPYGDIDLTAITYQNNDEDMAKGICDLLEGEGEQAADFLVRDVCYIPAQVKIVKCSVQHISVDISFNQVGGLRCLTFLEQVNHYIGRGHLFKHSIILIKAWCYYESRILGAQYGFISTYALEILVLHVINRFHSSVDGPLEVLYKFLDYYHAFDWENYGISIYGPVAIKCLQNNVVETPENHGNEMLLSKELLDRCLEHSTVQTSVGESTGEVFLPKYLNIVDPLKQSNNLGRSVSGGKFDHIINAFSHGFRTLREILILPEEKACAGLKKFFVNTLLNSFRQRPDVDAYAMLSCAQGSEVFSLNGEYNCHFNYLKQNQYIQNFGLNVPFHLSSEISQPSQFPGNVQMTSSRNSYCPGISSCIPNSCYPNSPQLIGSAISANDASTSQGMELYNPCLHGELELQGMHSFFPKFVIEENLPKVCSDFQDMHINQDMHVQSGSHGSEIDSKEKLKLRGASVYNLELEETGTCIIGTGPKEKSQETQVCIFSSNVDQARAAQGTNTGSDAKSSDSYIYVPQMRTQGGSKSEVKSNPDTGPYNIPSLARNDQGYTDSDLSQEEFPSLPSSKNAVESQQFVQPVAESQPSQKPSPCKKNEYGSFGTIPMFASSLQSFESMKQPTEDVRYEEPELEVATSAAQETLNASPIDEEMVVVQLYCIDDNKDFPPLCHSLKKRYPEQ